MNKNPFSNVGFSTSQERHNLIICAVLVVGIPGLFLSSLWIVQKDSDSKAAVELVESGLALLSKDNIDEGLKKLELAELKCKDICSQRTDNYITENETDLRDIGLDQKLTRLKGIRHLRRNEAWVDEEIIKIFTTQKRYDEILDMYRKLLKPWNENPTVLTNYDEAPCEVKMAQLSWERGQKSEAAKQLERSATLFPWNNNTRDLATKVFKDQKLSNKLKDLDRLTLSDEECRVLQETTWSGSDEKQKLEHISKLDRIIKNHPKCALALLLRSETQYRLSHYDKAIIDASSVVTMYPGLPDGYYARALAYSSLGKYRECLSDYNAALKLLPNSETLLNGRIGPASHLSDHDQVLRDRDKLIALAPDDTSRRDEKSSYLESIGKYKEAEQVIDEALRVAIKRQRIDDLMGRNAKPNAWEETNATQFPTSEVTEFRKRKATLRSHQNDAKGALQIVAKLIEEQRNDLRNYDLQADLLLESGDKKGALAAVNRAIELQGNPFVSNDSTPSFLTSKPTAVSDKLPPGSTLKPSVCDRMDKRATIYDALGDHAAALKEAREKLRLMKLELEATPDDYRCFGLINSAVHLEDVATAIYACNQFRKIHKNLEDYGSLEDKCERLADSPHHQSTPPVLKEFNKLYPGRKRIEAALAKANAQSGMKTQCPGNQPGSLH